VFDENDGFFVLKNRTGVARFPTRSRRRSRVEMAFENETKRAIYKHVPRSMIIKTPSAHRPKSAAAVFNNRQ